MGADALVAEAVPRAEDFLGERASLAGVAASLVMEEVQGKTPAGLAR